ncbi:MAG TPA: autotransporter assembly complex family protein [Gammaproteobacteria bacterium]
MSTRRHTVRVRAAITWLLLAGVCAPARAAVEVRIEGLGDELERNVRAFLSIAELEEAVRDDASSSEAEEDDVSDGDEDPTEARIRRLHAAADAEIAAALQPFGYYEPTVTATLERDGEDWVARYVVDPGPPTRITEIDIRVVGEGADDPAVRAAWQALPLARGEVLRHARYEAAKQALFDAAYNAGFIDVTFRRSELLVHRARREASVHLELDTGPRYYFGDITVEQDILNESFIERFVPIRPGEPFDTDRLLALQIALNDSGYFSDVVIDVERERAEDRHIPVVVRTTPRRTQEYTIGLGYGTDTGPRISLGVELRRINPRGHRFTSDLRLSSIEQAIAAEYRIPRGRNPVTDFLALRGSLGNQEIGDWETRQQSLGASWHDAWRSYQRRLYLGLQREEFWTELTPSDTEAILFGGAQFTRKVADDPLVPRRGYSWSVDLRGGSDALGSGTSFGRLHASANVVRSLGERVRVLLRGEYGAITATEFEQLPPSQRFYAGGDGSVRGYAYQWLGPQDANGARVGGRYLLVASAELEFRVVGDYGAALFFDVGNASNSAWPDLSRGVGIGARWRSPVGVVGLDIAHPLDDPDTDFRLHLSVGSDL